MPTCLLIPLLDAPSSILRSRDVRLSLRGKWTGKPRRTGRQKASFNLATTSPPRSGLFHNFASTMFYCFDRDRDITIAPKHEDERRVVLSAKWLQDIEAARNLQIEEDADRLLLASCGQQ